MTFTYNPTAWGVTPPPLELTRLYLGDTNRRKPLLEDEEIQIFLAAHNSDPVHSAFSACDAILAKVAKETDADGAGVRTNRSQLTTQIEGTKARLGRLLQATAKPRAMLGSKSAIASERADGDWNQPSSRRTSLARW